MLGQTTTAININTTVLIISILLHKTRKINLGKGSNVYFFLEEVSLSIWNLTEYKLAVLCGNTHVENQLHPFMFSHSMPMLDNQTG